MADLCSTNFSTDIAALPSVTKGGRARLVRLSDPACPFHASPLPFWPRVRTAKIGRER
jgi:hypothetical protein